jgi:hypothetical protein
LLASQAFLKVSKETEIIGPQTGHWFRHYGWGILPEVAPSNFYLFGTHKKNLANKKFASDGDVKQAVNFWLQKLDNDLL